MNKKLLTVAVGAALAVASGMASADVDWYGKANMSLVGGELAMGCDNCGSMDLDGTGSRIGINASEDLGNGMTVKYWHEWAIDTTEGGGPGTFTGDFTHRDNVLSLSGDFGTAFMADAASPYKAISAGKFDFFPDTVGDANKYLNQPAGPAVGYSNSVGDIGFAVVHSPNTTGGNTEDATGNIGNVTYNSGPLFVGAGFASFDDNAGDSDSEWILGAIYSMDNMTFLAAYQDVSGDAHTDNDETTISLGAKFGFDSNTVLVQYTDADNDDDVSGGTLTAIGFEHDMSKSLTVGVHYATNSPQDDSADDTSGWDAGFSYKF